MQAAANILGTSFGGFELAFSIVVISLFIVLLILGGLLGQIIKVRRFYSRYIAYVWHPEESIHRYDEMDDPVLKRIHQCLRLKPAMRVKGEYKPMDVAMEEPARTERMLKRAEWLGMKHCCKNIVCGVCCVLPGLFRTSSVKKGGVKTATAKAAVAAKPSNLFDLPDDLPDGAAAGGGGIVSRLRKLYNQLGESIDSLLFTDKGEKYMHAVAASKIQARFRGNKARFFVDDLLMYSMEIEEDMMERRERGEPTQATGARSQAMEELKALYFPPPALPPLDHEEAMEAGATFEELSVWFIPGSGNSLRGVLWHLLNTSMQMVMTLAISLFAVLGEEAVWARRGSLILMIAIQLTMAWWAIYGDPIDILTSYVDCLVSTLEFIATSLFLTLDYIQETTDAATLGTMGSIAGNVLLISAFVPTILSVYDSLYLPISEAFAKRMEEGSSCRGACCDIFVGCLITIPQLFGMSADMLQAVAEEGQSAAKEEERQVTRKRGGHRDRKAMSTDAIALSELHNHRESLNNRDSLEWEQRDSDACERAEEDSGETLAGKVDDQRTIVSYDAASSMPSSRTELPDGSGGGELACSASLATASGGAAGDSTMTSPQCSVMSRDDGSPQLSPQQSPQLSPPSKRVDSPSSPKTPALPLHALGRDMSALMSEATRDTPHVSTCRSHQSSSARRAALLAKKQELLSRKESSGSPFSSVTSPDQPVRGRTILMSPRLDALPPPPDALPPPEAAGVAQAPSVLGGLKMHSQHDTSLDA